MKIAMVSEHASPLAAIGGVDSGGQNVHVAALAGSLARRGHEVIVHTRRDDPALPRRVRLDPGVFVDHVAAGPAEPIPKDDLLPFMGSFASELERSWERDGPDVVHAHYWMSGLASLAAAGPLGVPVTQTFHALGVVKRRHQGARDPSPPQRVAHEFDLVARADHIIATCTDEVAELEALGADARRTSIVPCGVDLSAFSPNGLVEGRTPRPRLVVLGRVVRRKGVDDAIAAVADLPGVELVVAGGPAPADLDADAEVARLRGLAESRGVADRVVFRGRVERADVPPLLRSADVVVCPPSYEPFGIVPLEAMACGVPVVATAVGGMLDTVAHGHSGLHVEPGRPDQLAAAIARLLASPTLRRRMGAAGVQRARNRYGWASIASATEAVYGRVLDRSTAVAS